MFRNGQLIFSNFHYFFFTNIANPYKHENQSAQVPRHSLKHFIKISKWLQVGKCSIVIVFKIRMYSFELQTLQSLRIHFKWGVFTPIMKIRPSLHFWKIDLHGGVGYEHFELIPAIPCGFVILHREQACALEIFVPACALAQNIAMVLKMQQILLWTWRGKIYPWSDIHPYTCSWLVSIMKWIRHRCFQVRKKNEGSTTRFGQSKWIVVTMRELFI